MDKCCNHTSGHNHQPQEIFLLRHKIILLFAGLLFIFALRPFIAKQNCKRGDDFFRIDKTAYALKQYQKAIFLTPDFTYAYNELALLYEKMGRTEEAITVFEKTFTINPDNEMGYVELGRIYGLQRKYLKAEACFQKTLVINPHNKLAQAWITICTIGKNKDKKGRASP